MEKEDLAFTVTLDGIEVAYGSGETDLILHAELRPWSFNRGYWSGAYYDWVDNKLTNSVVAEFLASANQPTG